MIYLKKITTKYNNIFFAFINSIYGDNLDQLEDKIFKKKDINKTDGITPDNLGIKNNVQTLDKLIKNIKNSGMLDILCDETYIIKTFDKNILFDKTNMTKIYETSSTILNSIKDLEKKLMSEYDSDLDQKYNKLKETFNKLQEFKKLCYKFNTEFIVDDKTRKFEQIVDIINNMFNNYTKNRNKLFDEIITKIFEFKEENIEFNGQQKKQNNITKIKDDITYKEIIKFTVKAKKIIYDLHIEFFEELYKIFEVLNTPNIINTLQEQSQQLDNSSDKEVTLNVIPPETQLKQPIESTEPTQEKQNHNK